MMMELHLRGKTIEDIAVCLKHAPLNPRIISAIKSAHASGYILSSTQISNIYTGEFDVIAIRVIYAAVVTSSL